MAALGEAEALILGLHRRVLSMASDAAGKHFTGLRVADKALRKSITSKSARRMVQLDYAHALVRHITGSSCEAFVNDLRQELGAYQQSKSANYAASQLNDPLQLDDPWAHAIFEDCATIADSSGSVDAGAHYQSGLSLPHGADAAAGLDVKFLTETVEKLSARGCPFSFVMMDTLNVIAECKFKVEALLAAKGEATDYFNIFSEPGDAEQSFTMQQTPKGGRTADMDVLICDPDEHDTASCTNSVVPCDVDAAAFCHYRGNTIYFDECFGMLKSHVGNITVPADLEERAAWDHFDKEILWHKRYIEQLLDGITMSLEDYPQQYDILEMSVLEHKGFIVAQALVDSDFD